MGPIELAIAVVHEIRNLFRLLFSRIGTGQANLKTVGSGTGPTNGSNRTAAAFGNQDLDHGEMAAEQVLQAEPLRIVGMSRFTVAVYQSSGPAPGSVDVYIIQGSADGQGPLLGRLLGTITVTAVGQPELAEFHAAGRLMYLVLHAPIGGVSLWKTNIHGTGTS